MATTTFNQEKALVVIVKFKLREGSFQAQGTTPAAVLGADRWMVTDAVAERGQGRSASRAAALGTRARQS